MKKDSIQPSHAFGLLMLAALTSACGVTPGYAPNTSTEISQVSYEWPSEITFLGPTTFAQDDFDAEMLAHVIVSYGDTPANQRFYPSKFVVGLGTCSAPIDAHEGVIPYYLISDGIQDDLGIADPHFLIRPLPQGFDGWRSYGFCSVKEIYENAGRSLQTTGSSTRDAVEYVFDFYIRLIYSKDGRVYHSECYDARPSVYVNEPEFGRELCEEAIHRNVNRGGSRNGSSQSNNSSASYQTN